MENNRIILALNAKITDQHKCKTAMEAITADAYDEATTKTHWWSIGEDGESLFVLEQYDDAEAAIAHIKANPPARQDFFESIQVVNIIIYCDLTPELKEMYAPLNPIFMKYYGGFSK